MTPLVSFAVARTPDAERFMWFDVGTLPAHTDRRRIDADKITHLPFERTAIAFTDYQGTRGMLALLGGKERTVTVAGIAFMPDGFNRILDPFTIVDTGSGLAVHDHDEKQTPRVSIERALRVVHACFDALDVGTVAYQPTPIKKSLINAKRIAKGKLPLIYEWRTVVIEPQKQKAEPLGGHHASPRQHDRRGHWRNLRDGRRVWVRNCIVGDPSKGAVFKDYQCERRKSNG